MNTEAIQYSAPVLVFLILLVFWARGWSVDVKLHFVQLGTVIKAGSLLIILEQKLLLNQSLPFW